MKSFPAFCSGEPRVAKTQEFLRPGTVEFSITHGIFSLTRWLRIFSGLDLMGFRH